MSCEVDEYGMTAADHEEIRQGFIQHDKEQKRRALKAIWLKPVVERIRQSDGVICYRDNRDEEWTVWRAVKVTLAILLDRTNSTDEYRNVYSIAYWDAYGTYGGYTIDRVELYPRFTYQIFNDGECLM